MLVAHSALRVPLRPRCGVRFETISGVKYDETEVIWEWILSSLFFTVPVLIVLVCLCCGDRMAERVKTAIGVHFFENPVRRRRAAHGAPGCPPSCRLPLTLTLPH